MEKLPTKLVKDILERRNASEIQGLCDSNPVFRKQCNETSKRILQKDQDFYQLYLSLQEFTICITKDEDTEFESVIGIDNILDALKRLISPYQRGIEIERILVSHPPTYKMLTLNIITSYYSKRNYITITISGDFKTKDRLMGIYRSFYDLLKDVIFGDEDEDED